MVHIILLIHTLFVNKSEYLQWGPSGICYFQNCDRNSSLSLTTIMLMLRRMALHIWQVRVNNSLYSALNTGNSREYPPAKQMNTQGLIYETTKQITTSSPTVRYELSSQSFLNFILNLAVKTLWCASILLETAYTLQWKCACILTTEPVNDRSKRDRGPRRYAVQCAKIVSILKIPHNTFIITYCR